MIEALECVFDITWHGEVYGVVLVVPIKGDATVESAGPIGGDFVFGGEDFVQVFCVFFANIFNAKIIYD